MNDERRRCLRPFVIAGLVVLGLLFLAAIVAGALILVYGGSEWALKLGLGTALILLGSAGVIIYLITGCVAGSFFVMDVLMGKDGDQSESK